MSILSQFEGKDESSKNSTLTYGLANIYKRKIRFRMIHYPSGFIQGHCQVDRTSIEGSTLANYRIKDTPYQKFLIE